ncbi:MAG: hypothetical protein Q8P59_09770 [Dehalococcoidia bacterium]|nr:hypothetical protein [Dehalococcoidia bacterium]
MDIEFDGSPDVDELFNPSRTARRKMTRIADFSGFDFVGDNLLVRKSDQDLWRLTPDGSIERLFEASDEPLKG